MTIVFELFKKGQISFDFTWTPATRSAIAGLYFCLISRVVGGIQHRRRRFLRSRVRRTRMVDLARVSVTFAGGDGLSQEPRRVLQRVNPLSGQTTVDLVWQPRCLC